jgi:hypothetical protein
MPMRRHGPTIWREELGMRSPYLSSIVVCVLVSGCGSLAPSPTAAPLQLQLSFDTTAILYGDPIAWRRDLVNVSDDSIGILPGDYAEGFAFELEGPGGRVPREGWSVLVFGAPAYLKPGARRSQLEHVYAYFVVDTSATSRVLPVVAPGTYILRAFFSGTPIVNGRETPVDLVTSARFFVLPPGTARHDSISRIAEQLLAITRAVGRGEIAGDSAALRLKAVGREIGEPLWFGPPVFFVPAYLRAIGPYSPAKEAILQDAIEDWVYAHPTAAFAINLVPALDSARRRRWCAAVEHGGSLTANTALVCGRPQTPVR